MEWCDVGVWVDYYDWYVVVYWWLEVCGFLYEYWYVVVVCVIGEEC